MFHYSGYKTYKMLKIIYQGQKGFVYLYYFPVMEYKSWLFCPVVFVLD